MVTPVALVYWQTIGDALRVAQTFEEQTRQGHAFILALIGFLAVVIVLLFMQLRTLVKQLRDKMVEDTKKFARLIEVAEDTNALMVERQVNEAHLLTVVEEHTRRLNEQSQRISDVGKRR